MKPVTVTLILAVALVLMGLMSLTVGQFAIPLSVWLQPDDPRFIVLTELRAPRVLLGILVGGAMGLSGAALQGYSRNALADPGVLGVSSMASAGAVIAIYFGFTVHSPWMLPLAAAMGAGLGAAALMLLAGWSESATTFILAGVVLNTLGGAATALALSLAPGPWAQAEILNWLMGALTDRSLDEVKLAAPFILTGMGLMFTLAPALDALTLGEAGARALGVSMPRLRAMLVLAVALSTGAAVAVSGVIGFVGLITPHLLRPYVGARPGALLPPSLLGGALLLVAADTLVRLLPTGAELKLGVAMAAIGAPFFLWVLVRGGVQGKEAGR
jgi:iron complex transport system permease protein